jgi:predicted DNA-binding protein
MKRKLKGIVWYWSACYSYYLKDTIEYYDDEIEMYYLKDAGDFFPHSQLFKTKKEAAIDAFPPIV